MNFKIIIQSLLLVLFDMTEAQYVSKSFVSSGAYKTTSVEGNWDKVLIDGNITSCETTLMTENMAGYNYPYELRAGFSDETTLDRLILVMASQSNIRINPYEVLNRYCEIQMTSPNQTVIFEGECMSKNFDKKVEQISITFPGMAGKPIVICEVSFYSNIYSNLMNDFIYQLL